MTGRPAALSALAFASTARVADSAIPPIRAEILGCSAERVTSRGEELVGGEETLPAGACMLMGPSWHARDGQVGRVAQSGGSPAWKTGRSAVRSPLPVTGAVRPNFRRWPTLVVLGCAGAWLRCGSAGGTSRSCERGSLGPVSYTHLRAHETDSYLVC